MENYIYITGKNYCGPLNCLYIRLDENDNPKPGEEHTNKIDEACIKHYIAYRNENMKQNEKKQILI